MTCNISPIACAILLFAVVAVGPINASAEDSELDRLFELLQTAEPYRAAEIERQIVRVWSDSGSTAMNLLLRRGREAMARGELDYAVKQFSRITNQLPEFAEGWNARATAYYFLGQFDRSVADIQKTLALNPRHFGAITGFALILEATGDIGNALRAYHAVEEIHPNRPGLDISIKRLEKLRFDSAI